MLARWAPTQLRDHLREMLRKCGRYAMIRYAVKNGAPFYVTYWAIFDRFPAR